MRLHQMPSISSYAECVSFYAKARRWRDPESYGWQTQIGEPKKIDAAGKPYKSVRQIKHDDATEGVAYAWRYHDTDVVTWLTEDHIIVVPWASMSTTSFMEALLPSAFKVNMHHPMGCLIGVSDGPAPAYPTSAWNAPGHDAEIEAWYALREAHTYGTRWHRVPENDPVHLRCVENKWSVETHKLIDVPQVNPVKAHAARLKFKTADFSAWLDAVLAMNPRTTVRDAQAHALARAGDMAQALAEDMHANSDLGLQFVCDALLNPENYWGILASPHLRPPDRYTRGGRHLSRSEAEAMRHWRAHLKATVLLAAYRDNGAVEINRVPHLVGSDACNLAWRLQQRWGIDYHDWPVL